MRISRAQPIYSGKKRRHDAHSVETLYIFTPQSVCSNIRIPAWKQGNFIWERGNPLYARQSLAYEFSCGKLAQFWRSKVLSRLAWCALNFQKYFRHFPDAFSAFGSTPRASRGSFSCFGIAPEASPACFQPSGAFRRSAVRCFVFRGSARMLTPALSARGAEIIQNLFIRRMNHGRDGSCKGERQGARDGA